MKALEQMTRGVDWGVLDILVVDMPPGTGDAQISISQRLQLSGTILLWPVVFVIQTRKNWCEKFITHGMKLYSSPLYALNYEIHSFLN